MLFIKNLGGKLKRLRQKKGLTSKELAEKLNVSQSTVSAWETGTKKPRVKTVNNLANFFNVSVEYFYDDYKENKIDVICFDELFSSEKVLIFENKILSELDKKKIHDLIHVIISNNI